MKLENLSNYFAPHDLEWRIQQAGWSGDKPWAMVLCYITSRAVMDRLDEVCGPANWKNEFRVEPDNAISCGISIKIDGEWVTKWDAADATDIEAVKGGRSGAMKRAAVHWGIGRYLYHFESNFAQCQTEKPPTKDGWNKHYDKSTKKTMYWKTPQPPAWAIPKGDK